MVIPSSSLGGIPASTTSLLLGADSTGRVYAFDQKTQTLRVFGPNGSQTSQIGGSNANKLFSNVIGISVTRAGDVWLVDQGNQRFTILSQAGVSHHPRLSSIWRPPWWGGFGNDGALYDPVSRPGASGEMLRRVENSGLISDSIPIRTPDVSMPRRGALEFPLPYGARVLRAFDPQGFAWFAVSDRYRVVKESWKGDTVAVARGEDLPAALSREQSDSVTRYAKQLAGALEVTIEPSQIPHVAPLLQWIAVDDRGFLWVAVAQPTGVAKIEVFNQTGTHRCRMRTALKFAAGVTPVMVGDRLYGAIEDSTHRVAILQARISGR